MHLRLMGYLLLVGVRESGRRCMVLARAGTAPAGSTDAVAALRERVDGEVRFDEGSRAAYSTDASNFPPVPIGVVLPRTIEARSEPVPVCRERPSRRAAGRSSATSRTRPRHHVPRR